MGSRVDLRENGKGFGFDQTFNMMKVQALFSGSDLSVHGIEKSVKTDMCNTCDVTALDTQRVKIL